MQTLKRVILGRFVVLEHLFGVCFYVCVMFVFSQVFSCMLWGKIGFRTSYISDGDNTNKTKTGNKDCL